MISKLRFLHAVVVARHNEQGATAVEYAIIGSLIAAVIVVSVGLLGSDVNQLFETAEQSIP